MFRQVRCGIAARIVVVAATLMLIVPGQVVAADPKTASGAGAVGIQPIQAGTDPRQLGYTEDKLKSKLDARAAFKQAHARAVAATGGGMRAMSTVGPFTADVLAGWKTLHQKQNNWCLSAIVENILWYEFGDKYIAGGTYSWQYNIDSVIQKQEARALPWINKQIAANGSAFYYVVDAPAVPADFAENVEWDVTIFDWPTYAAIEVSSLTYAWHQGNPGRHATAAIGYSANGSKISIADPFTSSEYTPYCKVGVTNPGYRSSATYGCTYPNFSLYDYYQSLSFPSPNWI